MLLFYYIIKALNGVDPRKRSKIMIDDRFFIGLDTYEFSGVVPVEDEKLTEQDLKALEGDDLELYQSYLNIAEDGRKYIYDQTCKLSKFFDTMIIVLYENRDKIESAQNELLEKITASSIQLDQEFDVLKSLFAEPENWNKQNISRLVKALQNTEEMFNIKFKGDSWLREYQSKYISVQTPTKLLKVISAIFPVLQYHRHKERTARAEEIKAQREKEREERLASLRGKEQPAQPPKEKEKTYKDYWQDLSREEQIAEISQRVSLIEEYCARMDAVVKKLETDGDHRYAEANKILQNNIKKRFYAPSKDIANINKYISSSNGEAMRDENGNILLDEAAMTKSVIKGFFNKFENLIYECYKLDDLVGDVTLTDEEFIPKI